MEKNIFYIKNLEIHKMPGFSRGLEAFTRFSPQVNIITGKNASGKSSTSRMLQQIIWPSSQKGIEVKGTLSLKDDDWNVYVNSSQTSVAKHGIEGTIEGIPSFEEKNRYLLSLHQLISETDENLANELTKQSSGGYDIDEVQGKLKYSARISPINTNEYIGFGKAQKEYDTANRLQEELYNEKKTLDELRKEEVNARLAKKEIEYINLAIQHWEKKNEERQIIEKIARFPQNIERLKESDYETIEELEKNVNNLQIGIKKLTSEVKDYEEEIGKLEIDTKNLTQFQLDAIEERINTLSQLEKDIVSLEREIDNQQLKLKQVFTHLGEGFSVENIKKVSLSDIGKLEVFLKEAGETLKEEQELKQKIAHLEQELENLKETENKDLDYGIRLLGEWLKTSSGKTTSINSTLLFFALSAVIISSLVILISIYAIVLPITVAIILFFFLKKKLILKTDENNLGQRQTDYNKLGLSIQIDNWNIEKVTNALHQLMIEAGKQKEILSKQEIAYNSLKKFNSELKQLTPGINKILEQQEYWKNQLSLAEISTHQIKGIATISWLIQKISQGQDASLKLDELKVKEAALIEEKTTILEKINLFFTANNGPTVDDAISAKHLHKKFLLNLNRHKELEKEIRLIKESISEKESQIGVTKHKQKEIYERLEIEIGGSIEIYRLSEQLEDYLKVKKEQELLAREKQNLETRISSHSLNQDYQELLEEQSIDKLIDLRNQKQEDANKYEEVRDKIVKIETRISSAESKSDLQKALSNRDNAKQELQELFESNLSSITGDLIIQSLKAQNETQNQPKVVEEAKAILERITRGEFTLLLDPSDNQFKGYNLVLQKKLSLDELSTGTRIQLLLSIRLAYIERNEGNIKIPLIVDELIATSDDDRAKTIIESLIEISKTGRQIFYLTAQTDERRKWESILAQNQEVDYASFELGEETLKTIPISTPEELQDFRLKVNVPSPMGHSHNSYKEVVKPPPFNIILQEISEIHLWYLIEDPNVLYNCLKLPLTTWGQLEHFLKHNSEQITGISFNNSNKLKNLVEVLQRFKEWFTIGRFKPIDREVLVDSGAVSEKFIDDVNKKLKELNSNPKQLLKALEEKEVPGFLTKQVERLETFLLEHNYIDEQEPLTREELQLRLNAKIANMEDVRQQEVELIIRRVMDNESFDKLRIEN